MEMRCDSDLPLSERDILGDSSKGVMLLRSTAEERRMVSLASIYKPPGNKEQNNVTKENTMCKSCLCGTMALLKSGSGNFKTRGPLLLEIYSMYNAMSHSLLRYLMEHRERKERELERNARTILAQWRTAESFL